MPIERLEAHGFNAGIVAACNTCSEAEALILYSQKGIPTQDMLLAAERQAKSHEVTNPTHQVLIFISSLPS